MEKYLYDFSAKSLLDIGPGYSEFGILAARLPRARAISIVDFDQNVLDWQTAKYSEAQFEVVSVRDLLSIEVISRLNGNFDLILCQEVLEHLPNAEGILTALRDKLTDNGRIVVTVPTKFSERWLRWINHSYMVNETYGHVRQFDKNALLQILKASKLMPIVCIPTQPHYFVGHTWLFGTRMKIETSSGRILTKGLRGFIFGKLTVYSRKIFMLTGPEFWGETISTKLLCDSHKTLLKQ